MHYTAIAWLALVACGSLAACTDPEILEVGGACHNGKDDDLDGLSDCDDPGCRESNACEITRAQCDDGVDQDQDGRVDCEDPECQDLGFCEERTRSCDLQRQAGCTVGLACYAVDGGTMGSRCVLPGTKGTGEPCRAATECAPPSVCGGSCLPTCESDEHCPRYAKCVGTTTVRPCALGCIPARGNEGCGGLTCITTHQRLFSFGWGTSYAVCAAPVAWEGTAPVGATCDDPPGTVRPPTADQLARMCEPGLVCLPNGGSARCRKTCALREDGTIETGCEGGARCVATYPDDDRPLVPGTFVPGLCIP